MSINWSHAVDLFKKYGKFWYYGAQKLPIDAYKDVILLHEFVHEIVDLGHQWKTGRAKLSILAQQRHKAYYSKNHREQYVKPIVEMMYRRNITEEPIKNLLQSALLNTSRISYRNYDELKVYISGIAEWVSAMVADIIGCAPPWNPHAQALGESIRLVHLLLDLHKDNAFYLPNTDMKRFTVTAADINHAIRTRHPSQWVRDLVKYYLDEHKELATYAIQWIKYLNVEGHLGVAELIDFYESLVITIKKHNYNVFHPRFAIGAINKIKRYLAYGLYYVIWTKH